MSKIGVNLKINVTKLDKARFFTGAKGTYCDLTVFIDPDNPSEWGDHGIITQSKKQEEAKDIQLPIVGNAKVFWQDQSAPPAVRNPEPQYQAPPPSLEDDNDDDIPF